MGQAAGRPARRGRHRPAPHVALIAAVLAAGSLLAATPALALGHDSLTLFAEEKLTRDDNVFRVSKDLDPLSAIDAESKADNCRTTSLGLRLDLPVGRQRLQAAYTRNEDRYDRFTDLDFTGYDSHAVWMWQLGNDASGQLGYAETFALAPFADIQGRRPDPLRTRRAFFNGTYLATPSWRVQGGVEGLGQTNGDPLRRASDVDIVNADLALSYVAADNDSVGMGLRAEEGRFPNQEFVAGSFIANRYRQLGVGLVGEWTPSGASRIRARADRLSRRYEQLPQRDFDGNTFRVQYDWKPTGKLTLAAIAQRDISAYEDIRSSFVLVKGFALRPKLKATEKIEISGTFEYGIRDYLGDPGLGLGIGVGPARSDRVRSATLNVAYRPARFATLQVSAQHEARSSNFPFADYTANVIFASVRIAF